MGAMQEALSSAIPGAQDRIPLTRQIESIEQVAALGLDDLTRFIEEHETECVRLTGAIESSSNENWIRRARQSLRYLQLHKRWLVCELAKRRKSQSWVDQKQHVSIAAQARKAVQLEMTERHKMAEAAKAARIKASNDENARHIAVFKEVAREVLGAEMYEHLWELTRLRLPAPTPTQEGQTP